MDIETRVAQIEDKIDRIQKVYQEDIESDFEWKKRVNVILKELTGKKYI